MQKGVEAREAELRKILSVTNFLIRARRKASKDIFPIESIPEAAKFAAPSPVKPPMDSTSMDVDQNGSAASSETSDSMNGSTMTEDIPDQEEQARALESLDQDVSSLQEQARVLESQNQYLEIPYESIRMLGGKENELGCGKAATVYRGLWMNRNGAAEVRFHANSSALGLKLTLQVHL